MKFLYLLLMIPGLAMATNLELGIGQSSYTIRSDGTWYQLGNPHAIDRQSPAFKIGLTGNLWDDKLGADWHIDYANLGHLRSTCECTTLDSLYDMKAHRMLVPAPYPTAKYVGSGVADGIKLAISPYVHAGSWKIGGEVGLFPYRPGWDETVYHWSTSLNGPFVSGSHDTPKAIQLGGVIGMFVQRDRLTFLLEAYRLPTRFDASHSPALWTWADMAMLTYQF